MPRFCISANPIRPFQPLYLGNDNRGIGALNSDAILAAPAILLKFDDDATQYTIDASGKQRVITLKRPITDAGEIINDDSARIVIDEQIKQILEFQVAGGSVVMSRDLMDRIGAVYGNNTPYFRAKLETIRTQARETRRVGTPLAPLPALTQAVAAAFFPNLEIPSDISVEQFINSKKAQVAKRPINNAVPLHYKPFTSENFVTLRRISPDMDMLSIQDIPLSTAPIAADHPPTLALYAEVDVQNIMTAQIKDAGFREKINYDFVNGMGHNQDAECYTINQDGRKKIAAILPFPFNNEITQWQIGLSDQVIAWTHHLAYLGQHPALIDRIEPAQAGLDNAIAQFTAAGGIMQANGWPSPIARRDINAINPEALTAALDAIIINQNATGINAQEINISVPLNTGGHWYYCHILYKTRDDGGYDLTTTFAETGGQEVDPAIALGIHHIILQEFTRAFEAPPTNEQTIARGGIRNAGIRDPHGRGAQVGEVGNTCGPTICQYSKILLNHPDEPLAIGSNDLEVIDHPDKAANLLLSQIKSLARHDEENNTNSAYGLYFSQNNIPARVDRPPAGMSHPRHDGVVMRSYDISEAQLTAVTDHFLDNFEEIFNIIQNIAEDLRTEDDKSVREISIDYLFGLLANVSSEAAPALLEGYDYDAGAEPDPNNIEQKLYRQYRLIKNKAAQNDLAYLNASNAGADVLFPINIFNKDIVYLQNFIKGFRAVSHVLLEGNDIEEEPRAFIKNYISGIYREESVEGDEASLDGDGSDGDVSSLDGDGSLDGLDDGSLDDGSLSEDDSSSSPYMPAPSSSALAPDPESSEAAASADISSTAPILSASTITSSDTVSAPSASAPITSEETSVPVSAITTPSMPATSSSALAPDLEPSEAAASADISSATPILSASTITSSDTVSAPSASAPTTSEETSVPVSAGVASAAAPLILSFEADSSTSRSVSAIAIPAPSLTISSAPDPSVSAPSSAQPLPRRRGFGGRPSAAPIISAAAPLASRAVAPISSSPAPIVSSRVASPSVAMSAAPSLASSSLRASSAVPIISTPTPLVSAAPSLIFAPSTGPTPSLPFPPISSLAAPIVSSRAVSAAPSTAPTSARPVPPTSSLAAPIVSSEAPSPSVVISVAPSVAASISGSVAASINPPGSVAASVPFASVSSPPSTAVPIPSSTPTPSVATSTYSIEAPTPSVPPAPSAADAGMSDIPPSITYTPSIPAAFHRAPPRTSPTILRRNGAYQLTPLPLPSTSLDRIIGASRITDSSRQLPIRGHINLRETISSSFLDQASKREHDEHKAKFKLGILISEGYSVEDILNSTFGRDKKITIDKRNYEELGFNRDHTLIIELQFPREIALDAYDLSLIINGSRDRTAITTEDRNLTISAHNKFNRICESLSPRELDNIYQKFFDSVNLSRVDRSR